MPAEFEKCVRNGGRVRTVSGPKKKMGLGKGQFVKFCFIGNQSFRGETKTKKN